MVIVEERCVRAGVLACARGTDTSASTPCVRACVRVFARRAPRFEAFGAGQLAGLVELRCKREIDTVRFGAIFRNALGLPSFLPFHRHCHHCL